MTDIKDWAEGMLRHAAVYGQHTARGQFFQSRLAVPGNVVRLFRDAFPGYDGMVSMDTETTGLDAGKDLIIQLSALRVDLAGGCLSLSDSYIRLPFGAELPEMITELTGITKRLLASCGKSEEGALLSFGRQLEGRRTLVMGHNLQFDLSFLHAAINRHTDTCAGVKELLSDADYLDTLTVYRDRRPSPHKLEAAVREYGIGFVSHHRAIGDAGGVLALACAMAGEKNDLSTYINRFGLDPKYGLSTGKIEKVAYYTQEGIKEAEEGKTRPKTR